MTNCNMCGESCVIGWDDDGLIDCEVEGNYHSTPGNGDGALDDMTAYKFSMCEFCLDWLFCQFKIAPTVRDYVYNQPETWKPAAERVANDDWRRMKDKFFAEYNRRNLLRGQKINNE